MGIDEHTQALLQQSNFGWIDAVIVIAYLALSFYIGLRARHYVSDMDGFVGANRAIGPWLGVATMTGTELGLVTVMYSAQKGFTSGFAAFHIALVAGIVTFLVGLSGFIVVRLRRLKVLTIPEFYEQRFGRRTRVLGALMLVLGGVLNMGLFLKVGAMFLVGVTGLSSSGWALPVIMTALLVMVLVYTSLGGMFSVVITDYLQFVVLSVGLLLAVGFSIYSLGWSQIVAVVDQHMGNAGFNPFLQDSGFGAEYVLWMAFTAGLVSCAIWPTAVARALAMESTAAVKQQYRWSAIAFAVRFMIPNFLGICAFVYVVSEAPELASAFQVAAGDPGGVDNLYALPVFLSQLLPVGLLGLLTAAMIAAFMSTHDSYLLVWSSVITQDIVAPLMGERLSAHARMRLTRFIIVILGAYILYWGLVYRGRDDIWDYMAVTGAVYFTGAFAVLVGGLYWRRASSTGATLSLLSGLVAVLGLEPLQRLIGMPPVAGSRIGLVAVVCSCTMLIVGSLAFPDRNKEALA